jgi:hypothetical protein
MSILVLSSTRDAATPYHEWLVACRQSRPVRLLCAESHGDPSSLYDEVRKFKRYEVNGQVELAALALHAEWPIETIIARTEPDILRAAALRERLGIRGQTLASAFAYRNKLEMKAAFVAAGIPCAAFAPLGSALELVAFAEAHGFPVVVKPVDGAGGKDTAIIRDAAALTRYLEAGVAPNMMVESFVEGEMFHVDAFVVDGEIKLSAVSKYVGSALSFQDNQAWGSYVLPDRSPLVPRMTRLTQELVAALPAPELMVVHAEIWLTPRGDLVACEIASRTGGSLIPKNIARARHFDLNEIWVKAQAGLPWESLAQAALVKPAEDVKAFVIIPPRAGVLLGVDARGLPDFVDEYRLSARPGERIEQAQKQADCLASFMITAKDEAEAAARLEALAEWFEERAAWALETPAAGGGRQ